MRTIARTLCWFGTLALLACLLSGCGDCPPPASAPPPKIETVYVSKEVAVRCIKASDVPADVPKVGDQLNGDAAHDSAILAATVLALRAVIGRYAALMPGCTQ